MVRLGVDRTRWRHERRDVRDGVVHAVARSRVASGDRLVEVHGAGRVDRDQGEVGLVPLRQAGSSAVAFATSAMTSGGNSSGTCSSRSISRMPSANASDRCVCRRTLRRGTTTPLGLLGTSDLPASEANPNRPSAR